MPPKSRALLPDLSPWRASRDFRLMWCAGAVTVFGSFLTFVALPLQLKELTGSTVAVGALGAAEIVPLIVFGLYGGALADAVDRRKLILWSEAGLGAGRPVPAAQRAAAAPADLAAVRRRRPLQRPHRNPASRPGRTPVPASCRTTSCPRPPR